MLILETESDQRAILKILIADEELRLTTMADSTPPTDTPKPHKHGGKHHDKHGNPTTLPPGAPQKPPVDPPASPPTPPAEAVVDSPGDEA